MNIAIILLGSNINPEINLKLVIEKLSETVEIVKESSLVLSKPVGNQYRSNFQNKALKILTTDTKTETVAFFKNIEVELGRTQDSKIKGIIPMDIDLIFWNETLVHTDYERFEFVKKCVDEIMK